MRPLPVGLVASRRRSAPAAPRVRTPSRVRPSSLTRRTTTPGRTGRPSSRCGGGRSGGRGRRRGRGEESAEVGEGAWHEGLQGLARQGRATILKHTSHVAFSPPCRPFTLCPWPCPINLRHPAPPCSCPDHGAVGGGAGLCGRVHRAGRAQQHRLEPAHVRVEGHGPGGAAEAPGWRRRRRLAAQVGRAGACGMGRGARRGLFHHLLTRTPLSRPMPRSHT